MTPPQKEHTSNDTRAERFRARVSAALRDDPTVLEALDDVCAMMDRLDEMRAVVREEGYVVETATTRKAHPLLSEIRHLERALTSALVEFDQPEEPSPTSAAGKALARKRWSPK